MIKAKDVIRLKVPYPSISSELAVQSHMYVCKQRTANCCELIKCQTLKPTTLRSLRHYCIEKADVNRNPFLHTTIVDCDKLFMVNNITFDISLKTTIRPDVCNDLFENIIKELLADGYSEIVLKYDDTLQLNYALK